VAIDLHRPYRLNPAVAVRPEPFGALIYHFGNRRLSFLKTRQLATDTLDAAGVPASQWPRYTAALAALADSEVIDAR